MDDYLNLDFNSVYNPYYKLDDGCIYDKDKKAFVTVETDDAYKAFINSGNAPLSINERGYTREQLINSVLKFYKWDVGDCLLSLEQLKQKKLSELEHKAALFENNLNKDMYFQSSLGFKCNGDRRTEANIDKLIRFFDLEATGEPKTVDYRDYDNQTQKLTKEQLTTLLTEHVTNGNLLYKQKWQMQVAINSAQSIDELNKINLDFVMHDFSTPVKSLNRFAIFNKNIF